MSKDGSLSVSSPTQNIPVEILGTIFQSACADTHKTVYICEPPEVPIEGRVLPERSTAIRISQACSRWRDIALNLGSLWTHVEVRCAVDPNVSMHDANDSAAGEAFNRFLNAVLERSDPLPIHLAIISGRTLDGYRTPVRVLETIFGYQSRIKTLKLSGMTTSYFYPLTLPVLNELSLQEISFMTGSELKAPQITVLNFTAPRVWGQLQECHGPNWSNLVEINVDLFRHYIVWEDLADILAEASGLVTLRIRAQDGSGRSFMTKPFRSLPKLRTLAIEEWDFGFVTDDFLHCLETPSLTRFDYINVVPRSTYPRNPEDELSKLSSFLRRLPSLEVLNIGRFIADSGRFIADEFPDLTTCLERAHALTLLAYVNQSTTTFNQIRDFASNPTPDASQELDGSLYRGSFRGLPAAKHGHFQEFRHDLFPFVVDNSHFGCLPRNYKSEDAVPGRAEICDGFWDVVAAIAGVLGDERINASTRSLVLHVPLKDEVLRRR